jgi:hypothetical protein
VDVLQGENEVSNQFETSFTAKRTATEIQPKSLFGKDSFVRCLL